MPVLRTEQILWVKEKTSVRVSLQEELSPERRNSGQQSVPGGPACGKRFSNHCPQVTLWVGVASTPLPHPSSSELSEE